MKKIALLLLLTFNSFACSDVIESVFGADNYPDVPFNNFAAGNLGVITPQLATSYLVVAYRYLNQLPLNTVEQSNVLSVWSDFFSTYPAYPQPVYPLTDKMANFCSYNSYNEVSINSNNLMQFITNTVNDNKAYFNWRKYRLEVLELPTKLPIPTLKPDRKYSLYDISSFYSALALKEDNVYHISAGPGFNYLILATERLHAIKDALDIQYNSITKSVNDTVSVQPVQTEKEVLALWISAQQQIFKRSMDGSEKARELLAKLPDNIPQLVKDDIRYSIAASYLYDGTTDGAKTAAQYFETLANSTIYPWHEWAKYLQYRALNIAVNRMTHRDGFDMYCAENTPCSNLSDQSYEGMLELSKSTTDQKVKEAATDYVNVIAMRTNRKMQKIYDDLLQNSLAHIDKNKFSDLIAISNNAKPGISNEISLWLTDVINLRTIEDNEKPAEVENIVFNDAYSHWQNNPQNLAWLWLAVYTIKDGDISQQNALIKAVFNLTRQDPGFVPLRVALIDHFADIKAPTFEMSNIINDTLVVLPKGGDFRTTTLLLNERAKHATSLADFIEHAFFYPKNNLLACLKPIAPNTTQTHYSANYVIDNAAIIINTLPPSVLIEIAAMPNLPDNYRPVIYANLWVRSIMFNNTELEKTVSIKAMKHNPVLTDTIMQMMKSNNPDERSTLFLSALLHYPNLSPMINLKPYETWQGNDLKDPSTTLTNSIVLRQEYLDTSYNNWFWIKCDNCKGLPAPSFLNTAQRMEYQIQLKHINNLESASNYISASLIALANRYPHDLRYAELLALFIKYTKYANGGSKKAFTTLKKLYPNSQWAKRTKFYY